MLYENDVVDAVATWLRDQGWTIESVSYSKQTGDDIAASRNGQKLRIEAKGATSAVPSSGRFGKPFTKNQVNDHVAKAVLRALRYVSDGYLSAIALSDNPDHRAEVAKVQPALQRIGVAVFWVAENRDVNVRDAKTLYGS